MVDRNMLWQILVFFAIVFVVNIEGKAKDGIENDNGKSNSPTETQNNPKFRVFQNILQSLSKKGKRCLLILWCLRIFLFILDYQNINLSLKLCPIFLLVNHSEEKCNDKEDYCQLNPNCMIQVVKENCPKLCHVCIVTDGGAMYEKGISFK